MKLTKENTSKLQQLNQFCREKQQLETKLASLKNDLVSLLATTTFRFGTVQKWVRDHLALTSSLVSHPALESAVRAGIA